MRDRYPKRSAIWPGAILGYLVNSIMIAESATFSTFSYWKGGDYVINGHGLYGAISFENPLVVGTFFDPKSDRSPYQCPETYDFNRLFQGMSPRHRSLVENRVLQHMYEVVDGRSVPCITAAFWDEGEYLMADDPWDVVLAEGARLVRIELIEDIEEALAEWCEAYQMTPEQVAFARSLFNRKMARPEETIQLSLPDSEWLRSISKGANEASIETCREKLAAIGILLSRHGKT